MKLVLQYWKALSLGPNDQKFFVLTQDYEIHDINCSSSPDNEYIEAQLIKPPGFSGYPILADVGKFMDPALCKITQTENASSYSLIIHNYDECGVRDESGFVSVRVWFPKVEGVVTLSDQEVTILCKPPRSIITQNKAASYSSHLPSAARVSGIVEELPDNLEYEVALYKDSRGDDGSPINEEVPIGTHLQLRASINTDSAWKYIKLMDVSISPQSINPIAEGHISLMKNGCRLKEFISIVPKHPFHPKKINETNYGEVRLEFEAIILQATQPFNRLWIHARIKGCVHKDDCISELCSREDNLVKKRRKRESSGSQADFDENVGFTVVMPGEKRSLSSGLTFKPKDCYPYLIIASLIGFFLTLLSTLLAILSFRLYRLSKISHKNTNSMQLYRNSSLSCSAAS
ncbi:unnamed protein product [Lepeophtheirus salmonis]|uniref:(salmon louse) hypothetical protein n=1 Tax=Lepeophtheirus salmonis TaxID=72036 RepID=A0A7R8D4A5_LEPSM|nr:unnamed protein product [Lepeophtheirus salmonis]CAF2993803.1 unnamed protein product [Lepeophtheirus salmonis]